MGGYDDFLGGDPAMLRDGRCAHKLPNRRMLINMQPLCNGRDKFQRMDLGLIGVSDRSGHREREGQILAELPMKSQLFQRLQKL